MNKDLLRKIIKEEYQAVMRERDQEQDAPADGKTAGALEQYKVRLFFERLQANQALSSLLNFTSPLQQAQAIVKFAQLVGIPPGKIPAILQQLKALSKSN